MHKAIALADAVQKIPDGAYEPGMTVEKVIAATEALLIIPPKVPEMAISPPQVQEMAISA